MNGRYFLDTNVFVYAFSSLEDGRSVRANALITRALTSEEYIVSYQVIQEFISVVTKKPAPGWARDDLRRYLREVLSPMLKVHSSMALFESAVELQRSAKISWYDSLIVAAALQSECDVLYTEDLQHGQRFGQMVIENPFRD